MDYWKGFQLTHGLCPQRNRRWIYEKGKLKSINKAFLRSRNNQTIGLLNTRSMHKRWSWSLPNTRLNPKSTMPICSPTLRSMPRSKSQKNRRQLRRLPLRSNNMKKKFNELQSVSMKKKLKAWFLTRAMNLKKKASIQRLLRTKL